MKTVMRKPFIGKFDHQEKKCICDRAKRAVLCENCGYYCKGRVHSTCSEHPNVLFMMDFDQCPRCYQSGKLKEVN